jgi:hypothetical protein
MKRLIIGLLLCLIMTVAMAGSMWTLPVPKCWANGLYTIELQGSVVGSTDTVRIFATGYEQIVHITTTNQLVLIPQPDRFTPVDVMFYNSNGSIAECVTNSNMCSSLSSEDNNAYYVPLKDGGLRVTVIIKGPRLIKSIRVVRRNTWMEYWSFKIEANKREYIIDLKAN